MESDARYAWVGFAVLSLVMVMVAGFFWLKDNRGPDVRRYTVYFKNQSLEGLQINSNVRMQGIKVGKVVDYTILPGHAKTVRVILEVDARTPVWQGAEAVVNRNLVTSLAAIDIDNVRQTGRSLDAPPNGEAFPVINEGVPQLARISNTLEGLGKTGGEAIVRVNQLLSDDNQQAFNRILANLADTTDMLRQLGPEFKNTLGAARQAAIRMDGVGAELSPILQGSRQHLDRLTSDAERTLAATRTTMSQLDGSLREMQSQLKLSLDLGMQELQISAQAFRAASDTLQATSQEFSDPGRILYGPYTAELGPGEQ